MNEKLKYGDITGAIIAAAMDVHTVSRFWGQ